MNESTAPLDSQRNQWIFIIVLAFFFISGACGLLYQVVWTRKLVLLFGTTSYAVSTVLSIFFLGLGLGSLWGGKLADKNTRPMRLYGIFEVIIGIWALLFIVFISAGESLVIYILQMVGPSYTMGIVLRGLMATLFLLVPVTLMGATLPLLSRFVTAYGPVQGLRIGGLYSLNTFGAVAGCLVTGFTLLATYGYTKTTLIGAMLNIGVGILAWGLSIKTEGKNGITNSTDPDNDSGSTEPTLEKNESSISSRLAFMVVMAFALSGFCSLALEVMWMRLLTVLFLGTTYAFTTMLTSVLCGIALGSSFASLIIDRIKDRVVAYGFIQTVTGAACVIMLMVFPALPDMLQEARFNTGSNWDQMVIRKFMISFSVLFIPTFLFGMSFPFVVRIIANSPLNLGKSIGRLYSANTFGGVLGSLVGGYLLIPTLGTHMGILLLSAVLGISGIILIGGSPHSSRLYKGVLGIICAFFIAWGIHAMQREAGDGMIDVSKEMNDWFLPEDQRIVDYNEGVEGTVMVTAPISGKEGTDRVLWINAVQATASIEKGVKMNRFQGVLPFFFDRPMDNALFICFGSGITAGTLSLSPFEQIDAVEISSDVLEMAEHFKVDNFDVLNSPRINVIVDDGRNYLLTTEKQYDLITFEPMPLALSGVSTFYTKEYYEQCLDHLTKDGIVSQWIPLHNGLTVDVVQSLVKTFTEVFPEVTAWFINADLFLIGSQNPQSISYSGLEQALANTPELETGLDKVYLPNVPELLATYFTNKEGLVAFAGDAAVMSDDLPWAEFLAPKMIFNRNVPDLLTALEPQRQSPLTILAKETGNDWALKKEALALRHKAHLNDFSGLRAYYSGMGFGNPEEKFRESLKLDPNDSNAIYYLSEILVHKSRIMSGMESDKDKVLPMLLEAQRLAPFRTDIYKLLGDTYHDQGDIDKAWASYQEHIRLGGLDPVAIERTQ